MSEVFAAGGVVWRVSSDGQCEVLLVHRPQRRDWSFPKGKRETGEDDETCALREVEEETGFCCSLGAELPVSHYRDARGRQKTVRYWSMRIESGSFTVNDEVDESEWLLLGVAAKRLTYDQDRLVLAAFREQVAEC